jgi:metal-responsive CopG/Arc/MetJ family transcriptional regulator
MKMNTDNKSGHQKKVVNSEVKRLNVNVDADLHARFKSIVARDGSDMTETIERMLRDWLAKNEGNKK